MSQQINNNKDYSEFVRQMDSMPRNSDRTYGPDPFDQLITEDDEEIEDFALYRLGVR